MQNTFILVSTLLALTSPLIYAKAIFSGQAKPHRTTRLVLLIITTLTTAALFAQHDTVAIWLAGVSMVQSIIIFILSLKYGMGGYSKSDIICLVIAVCGIILWQVTKNPVVALYFAVLADFTGFVPTLIKTYKLPSTEHYLFFLMDTFAGLFSIMAIKTWVPEQFLYPMYIFLLNLVEVFIIIRPNIIRRLRA